MPQPIIRILPHTRAEFPSSDHLRTWMLTALKANGGCYLLRSFGVLGAGNNPPGSIVLFRFHDQIVGEAVIEQDVTRQNIEDLTPEGQPFTYEGYMKLAPSSIRAYIGSLSVAELGDLCGRDFSIANPYYKIDDWAVYPKILARVAPQGFL